MITNFIVVSSAAADIFRQFDLGEGGVYPIELFQGDRIERIEGDWFFLNLGSRKWTFLPDKSVGGFEDTNLDASGDWALSLLSGDQIAVSVDALKGPDLWIDASLRRAFFLSGRLITELKKANLVRNLRHAPCIVTGQE